MKIRMGDVVAIISGKDKGKQGRVLRVLKEKNRVVVEGANMRVRHIKRTQNQAGQRVSFEASLHASNVMLVDPKTKKPTRVAYKVDEKGNKKRIAVASGEVITKAAAPKVSKDAKDTKAKKESKETKADESSAKPTKQPFWKRGGKGGDKGAGQSGGAGGNDSNVIQTAHRAQGG